jgi:hypothetical protein
MSEIDHTSSSSWTINPGKVSVIKLSIVQSILIKFNVFVHHSIALLTVFQTYFVLSLIRTTRRSQIKEKEPDHATQVWANGRKLAGVCGQTLGSIFTHSKEKL